MSIFNSRLACILSAAIVLAPDGRYGGAPEPAAATARQFVDLATIRIAQDVPEEVVPTPEWGEGAQVLVKGLSKNAMEAIQKACMVQAATPDGKPSVDPQKLADELTLACVVEPALTRDDLTWLYEKAAAPVNRIQQAVLRVSGLTKDAVGSAKS